MKITKFQQILGITAIATVLGVTGNINQVNAFNVTTFSPTNFSDAAAGITGYEIEDFEDTTLIPGLSVTYHNRYNTQPSIYTNQFAWYTPNNSWDGNAFLGNVSGASLADITTLNFAGMPSSVGFGISNFQYSGAQLLINGEYFATLDSLAYVKGVIKNVYLRIDAESGEAINSVSIDGIAGDFLAFDRVAIGTSQNVPEPLTVLGSLTALGFGVFFKQKLSRQTK